MLFRIIISAFIFLNTMSVQAIQKQTISPVLNYFHPMCLLFTEIGNRSFPDSVDCRSEADSYPLDSGATFVELESGGYISYSMYPNDIFFDHIAVVTTSYSGGGTGVFDSILVLDVQTPLFIKPLVAIAAGDRCNDGLAEIENVSANGIAYSVAATPFRLLNPLDDTDWRSHHLAKSLMHEGGKELDDPATFMDWQPYDDIFNSANSCSGRIYKFFDFDTGLSAVTDVNFDKIGMGKAASEELHACYEQWVSTLPDLSQTVAIANWLDQLSSLEKICKRQ